MKNLSEIILPIILKDYLIYAIYFFGITALFLFLTLVIHKTYVERKEKRKTELIRFYRSAIEKYLKGASTVIDKPSKRIEYDAFSETCIDIISRADEVLAEKVKLLLKENGVVGFYKKMAYSGSWIKRFYCVETLSLYRMYDLKDFFIDILNKDPMNEVKAKALWGLSLIADEESLWIISRRLSKNGLSLSSKFNEYIYTSALNNLKSQGSEVRCIEFLRRIKDDGEIPLTLKKDIISAAGVAGLKEAVNIIEDYMHTYSNDILMRIACIRALGMLNGLKKEQMIEGLSHSDWRVRAVTAKAISGDIDGDVIMALRKALYDEAYFVRLNSAKTLSSLGDKGISALVEERSSGDKFVQDIARYLLQEVGANV